MKPPNLYPSYANGLMREAGDKRRHPPGTKRPHKCARVTGRKMEKAPTVMRTVKNNKILKCLKFT